eukprot:CAMPEP_0170453168 /NCGR_PEP_ID=MMETSP0123-20130129/1832_1 /TAXON_ID=182087 /ORGANISM="Favella ehrenbergii, Strain Fehren 1" /LENGTH=106 /DNA_ID=CAMNT_0010715435 /DNA_START=835 /DNA_END=1155 /DNA_ORIENTATION=+
MRLHRRPVAPIFRNHAYFLTLTDLALYALEQKLHGTFNPLKVGGDSLSERELISDEESLSAFVTDAELGTESEDAQLVEHPVARLSIRGVPDRHRAVPLDIPLGHV